jgi:hypothetical protein
VQAGVAGCWVALMVSRIGPSGNIHAGSSNIKLSGLKPLLHG